MPEAGQANTEDKDLSFLFANEEDEGGHRRMNFYIQPRLPPNIHAWLVKTIKAHGGRISNEDQNIFPRRGYILVDPTSRKGRELTASKPTDLSQPRWLISWTFITACLEAKKLLDAEVFARTRPIFLDPDYDEVLKVYIHPSIAKDVRGRLATEIASHGGIIVDKKKDARVIICPPTGPKLLELRKRYPDSSEMAIESPIWVNECIKGEDVEFTHRKAGRQQRIPFTHEDDLRLVEYLAEVCPKPEPYRNGRGAPKLYDRLMENPEAYPWAVGHTASSWRERYKTQIAYMDKLIEKHLRSKRNQNQDKRQLMPNHSEPSGSGAQIKAKSVPSKKRKAPAYESDDDAPERQRKTSRPRTVSPDDVREQRRESVIEAEEVAVDAGEPEWNDAADEGHADENPPALELEPLHDVLDGHFQSQSVPSPSVDEVDEEDDLSFELGPATQAMVAEHQALSHRITRSASRASSRGPSPGVPGLIAPGKYHLPDMEPVPEAMEDGDGDDSADNTQEVEAILAGQETQAVADNLPSNTLELRPKSAGSNASGPGPMVSSRNGKERAIEVEQLLGEDVYNGDGMLGGANYEATPGSILGVWRNAGLTSQDSAPSSHSPPTRAHNRRAGSSSAYITPTPAKRLQENVDSSSTIANRPRRLREPPFQIIPVHPERVPARARSPSPIPMFAGLDPAIARALGKMCKKFSFSPEEVKQKWEINRGDLMATSEVLEKNRRFLDQNESYTMDE